MGNWKFIVFASAGTGVLVALAVEFDSTQLLAGGLSLFCAALFGWLERIAQAKDDGHE